MDNVVRPEAGPAPPAGEVPRARRSDDAPLPRPPSNRRWWSSEIAVLLGAYVVARLLALGGIAVARSRGGLTWQRALAPWDGPFYLRIIDSGYPSSIPEPGQGKSATAAFFPLFPLVVRGLSTVLRTPAVGTAVVLNVLLGALAVVLVREAARAEIRDDQAIRAVLLFIALPGAVVFMLVMSDAMLVPLFAAGLLALQRKRWLLAGLAGMAATAVRPNGFGLVAAAAVAAWLAIRRERDLRSLLEPVLAPLGAFGYWGYLWWRTGVPDAWFVVENRFWNQHLDFGVRFFYVLKNPALLVRDHTYLTVEIGFVIVLLAAWAWFRGARLSPPTTAFCCLLVAQMIFFGGVGPRPRFLLATFPLLWLIVQRVRDRWLVLLGVLMVLAIPVLSYLYSAQLAIP